MAFFPLQLDWSAPFSASVRYLGLSKEVLFKQDFFLIKENNIFRHHSCSLKDLSVYIIIFDLPEQKIWFAVYSVPLMSFYHMTHSANSGFGCGTGSSLLPLPRLHASPSSYCAALWSSSMERCQVTDHTPVCRQLKPRGKKGMSLKQPGQPAHLRKQCGTGHFQCLALTC